MFNPFPGLRPFEADEDHLFFGREKETDELLRRLRTTRFVSVVGSSGSGKSSLVRSGLIPSLHSGFMVAAGSSWRVATFRPGEDPVGHLARALNEADVLGPEDAELTDTNRILLETTLRRGALGLTDAVRNARIPKSDNVLVVVDQFEELFRFQRSRLKPHSRGEAVALVNLLLEATKQERVPIYVVLTMRSDFIGDCIEYPGLPEAVNAGQYLVPRLSRSELRSAITGPVAVGGGAIAQRLVLRVLNDLGHDQDQLPVLQHALMRTWDHWITRRQGDEPIDIVDYESVGTLQHALSMHAEEAYSEAGAGAALVERVFKALTDTFSDPRGVRRPTTIQDLAEIAEAPRSAVIEIVEIFRQRGRSFLMPPPGTPLQPHSIVDLSHESLMRCWSRLIGWAEEERTAAGFYIRLSQAAAWHREGAAGLWRDPELELALQWQKENRPTAAWARRFDESFEAAIAFLAASEAERDRVQAEQERERKNRLRRAHWAAAVFGTMSAVAGLLAFVAWSATQRAEVNFSLARGAVEEMLSSADLDLASVGADVPQMQEFRAQLLEKAQLFYAAFMNQRPRSEELQRQLAFAHFRMGHINRMLARPDDAQREYETAIERFGALAAARPENAEYREAQAGAYNWLGETLRASRDARLAADRAYAAALALQERLVSEASENTTYRKSLARTRYNRGILRASAPQATPQELEAAEMDFREAVSLLEPLAEVGNDPAAAQELARVYNNLGGLADFMRRPATEIQALYERAIAIDEQLVARDPRSREYKLELAKYYENLANLLRQEGQIGPARERNQQAIALLSELALPAPSVAIEYADSRGLRGLILQAQQPAQAEAEYRAAFDEFERLQGGEGLDRLPLFHERFADFLISLAGLVEDPRSSGEARRLLSRAVGLYESLAGRMASSGSPAELRFALDNLGRVLPALPEPERGSLTRSHQQLTVALNQQTAPAR
jgi:tetratricopeptide (TPR) repeat protein